MRVALLPLAGQVDKVGLEWVLFRPGGLRNKVNPPAYLDGGNLVAGVYTYPHRLKHGL